MVKARRKLKLAEYALRAGDHDSAVGDAYRCIELCMRALLLNRGYVRSRRPMVGCYSYSAYDRLRL
jgi:HEPN domain-containing protein